MSSERDFTAQFTHPGLAEQTLRELIGPGTRARQRLLNPREYVLESISHPRLRELVETAYKLARKQGELPWIRTQYDYLEKVRKKGADAYDYRNWVWERLHASDLAQRLPGGKSTLPDIADAMSEPWRSLEKHREPRNYEQLLRHVTRYLDWYVEPTQRVKSPVRQIALWTGFAMLPLMIPLWLKLHPYINQVIGLPANSDGFFGMAVAATWGLLMAVLSSVSYRSASQSINGRKLHRFHNAKHNIDSAELFYYLAFAYADRPDPDAPTEL